MMDVPDLCPVEGVSIDYEGAVLLHHLFDVYVANSRSYYRRPCWDK